MAASKKCTYVGALEIEIIFADTGRKFTVATGDSIKLLANEAKSLAGNRDWISKPASKPTEGKPTK